MVPELSAATIDPMVSRLNTAVRQQSDVQLWLRDADQQVATKHTCTVLDKLGQGGQGSVWRVALQGASSVGLEALPENVCSGNVYALKVAKVKVQEEDQQLPGAPGDHPAQPASPCTYDKIVLGTPRSCVILPVVLHTFCWVKVTARGHQLI